MKRKIIPKKEKKRRNSKRYYKKKRPDILEGFREKYALLKKHGYSADAARKLSHKTQASINAILIEDGKLKEES